MPNIEPPFPVQPLTEVQVIGSICREINTSLKNLLSSVLDFSHLQVSVVVPVIFVTYLSLSETIKAIMDSQHVVTLNDAHPDCSTNGSVHTSTGSTDVHDGHIDVALVSKKKIYLD